MASDADQNSPGNCLCSYRGMVDATRQSHLFPCSKGLSVGAFLGIILPCVIVVIAGLTFDYVYLTKPKGKNHITKDSGEVFDSGIQMNE